MEGKIGGTVRQIEAGDELSGSIINLHPLLFNILKSHTHNHTHTLNELPAILPSERSEKGAALKILLMLKASAASQRS